MSHVELGKIKSARFGSGGYQDAMIGFTFEIGGDGWGTMFFLQGGWGHVDEDEVVKPNSDFKWTHESRIKQLGESAWRVHKLMQDAKVSSLDELVGVPVRAYFENPCGQNINFEILKEVI